MVRRSRVSFVISAGASCFRSATYSRCSLAILPERTRWWITSTDWNRYETHDHGTGARVVVRMPIRQEGCAPGDRAGYDARGFGRGENRHARRGAGHLQAAGVRQTRSLDENSERAPRAARVVEREQAFSKF